MKISLLFFVLTWIPFGGISQDLSGVALLDKAIAYHDPQGNWPHFNGWLNISMQTPTNGIRESKIHIDLPGEYFYVKAIRNANTTEYTVDKGACSFAFNGSYDISEELMKEHNLSCDRAKLYQNYYTYLYGLPMKLKDPGTKVHEKVSRKSFKGKEYLVLKVTYDEAVGSDVWFFYFDPKSYAMEIYQFFKGDSNGKGKDTGEYILLSEEININGIRMPKVRAWYYNKDNAYLGTDLLKQ